MSAHNDIHSALRSLEDALDTVSKAVKGVNGQAEKMIGSLRDLGSVRQGNAEQRATRLGEICNQIGEDTRMVEARQSEVDSGFDRLCDQKRKSTVLVKWRFRQARMALQKQHLDRLHGVDDVSLSLSHYGERMAESFTQEHALWNKQTHCDRKQMEIGEDILQALGMVQERARNEESFIKERDERIRTEKATQLNEKGAENLAVGRHNEAIEVLTQAVDIRPEEYGIRTNLGWAYLRAGRRADARAEALKAIEITDTFAEAYYLLGHVELADGNAKGAIQAFAQANELAPESEENLLALGLAHMANGESHIGLGYWRRISSEAMTFERYPVLAPQ